MSDIFKSLPDLELIECLEHFCNFAVPSEIIKNPTPAFLKAVLQIFLKDCHLNTEAMEMMPWNDGAIVVEHKELYEDMPMVIFFTVMMKFMHIAGVMDFSVKDLIDPKPKRTRKILTLLISVWKYILSMKKRFEEVEYDLQNEIAEGKRLLEMNEKLNEKYLNLLSMKVDPEKKAELLMVRKSGELDEMIKAKDAINEEYQVLKTNIATEEKKGSELDVNVISEKEKIEEFNNRILKSPQRFKSDLEELKDKILECDKMILGMLEQKEQKKQGLTILTTCLENFNKFGDLCNELAENVEILKNEASTVDERQKVIDELSLKLRAGTAKVNAVSESMGCMEQKWAQTELQTKMQVEGQKKILEVNQRGQKREMARIQSLESDAVDLDLEIVILMKKSDGISNKIKEVINAIAEKGAQRQQEYEEHIQALATELTLAVKIAKEAV